MDEKDKSMIKTFISFLFLALMFGLGYYIAERSIEADVVVKTQTDTIKGDSIPYEVEVEKPVPKYIYRDTGKDDTVVQYKDVDTSQILSDYFSRVIYSDTLKDDSSAFISLSDTLSKNRIQGRKLMFQNRRETKVVNKTTMVFPQNGLYAGGKLGLGITGLDLMYLDGSNAYGIGVDAIFLDESKYFFTIQYKRQLWKKQ